MTGPQRILDALLARRSLREAYDCRPVPREDLERVVACGLAAPSSKNAQPWRLHVVTDRSLLDQLAGLVTSAKDLASYVPHDPRTGAPHPQYRSTVLDSAAVLRDVPATIWIENIGVFTGGRDALVDCPRDVLVDMLQGYAFELIGIGAAVENMWIAANALGLAAVFMGDVVIAAAAIRGVLTLRGDLIGVLALGHSLAEPRPPMDGRAEEHVARVVWH